MFSSEEDAVNPAWPVGSVVLSFPSYCSEGMRSPFGSFRYDQLGFPINFYTGEESFINIDRRHYRSAPVNSRYAKRVARLVSWREVLQANGYKFIDKNRGNEDYTAGVRHDAKHGDVFYIRCVLHDERSSSMCLLPWGFHCFGCGTAGTIVDFVAGVNHLLSAQAIKTYITDTFPQMRESALIPK